MENIGTGRLASTTAMTTLSVVTARMDTMAASASVINDQQESNEMPTVYKAKLEFQTEEDIPDHRATSHTIMFESDQDQRGPLTAQVMRWFANRHEAAPEYFYRLCAVEVCGQRFEPFQDDGFLHGPDVSPYFVWKIDAQRRPTEISLESIGWEPNRMDHLSRVIQGVH